MRVTLAVVIWCATLVPTVTLANAAHFATGKTIPAGHSPSEIAIGDFNHDGNLDLVVTPIPPLSAQFSGQPINTSTVNILFGHTDGTFSKPVPVQAGANPQAVVVADVNGDGNADLIVGNQGNTVSGSVSVILGNQDGTFQSPLTILPGSEPVAIAVADVDGDSNLDLIVADQASGSVLVLLGNGRGGFGRSSIALTGVVPQDLALADFNHDLKPDIVVASGSFGPVTSPGVAILINKGDGTFKSANFLSAVSTQSVTVGDFNHDGNPDVAADLLMNGNGIAPVGVFLGHRDGTFQPMASYGNSNQEGCPGESLQAVDLNGDGNDDLIGVGICQTDVLIANADGTFSAPISYAPGLSFSKPVIARFSPTHNSTIVIGLVNDGAVLLLRSLGDGTLYAPRANQFSIGTARPGVAAGDFNGDGAPDIATAGVGNYVSIGLNKGDGIFRAGQQLSAPTFLTSLAVGDLNGDGKLDVIAVGPDYLSGGVFLYFGNGDGTFNGPTVIGPPASGILTLIPSVVTIGDFNKDGIPDFAVLDSGQNLLGVALGLGGGNFNLSGLQNPIRTGNGPAFLAAGFLQRNGGNDQRNGGNDHRNGGNDMVVANCGAPTCTPGNVPGGNGGLTVVLGTGSGVFQPSSLGLKGAPNSVAIGDFNQDGNADLAVAYYAPGTNINGPSGVAILLGNGDGTFKAPVNYITGTGTAALQPNGIQVGDFDGDGKLDLLVTINQPNGFAVMRGNGDGTFASPQFFPGNDGGIAVDVNGDGALDLVGTGIVLNAAGTFISAGSSASHTTLGSAIALTARVSASVHGSGVPSGRVSFVDTTAFPQATIGTASLVNGKATLLVSNLIVGEHVIQALYSGDATFNPHIGPTVTIEIAAVISGKGGSSGGSGTGQGTCSSQAKNASVQKQRVVQFAGTGALLAPSPGNAAPSIYQVHTGSGRHDVEFHRPKQLGSPSIAPNLGMLMQPGIPLTSDSAFGFDGLDQMDSRMADNGNQASTEPPDMAVAVSSTQIVQAVNAAVAVYTKSGSLLAGPATLNSLFGLAPAEIHDKPPIYGPFITDARVVFDADTQRWFITAMKIDTDPTTGRFLTTAELLIAISNSTDATAGFRNYAIDVTDAGEPGCPCAGDQPLIGINHDGLYITTDQYAFSDLSFHAVLMLAIDKYGLVKGTALSSPSLQLLQQGEPGFAIQPAVMMPQESMGLESNGTEFFMNSFDYAGTGDNRLQVWAMTNTASLRTSSPALRLQSVTVQSETYLSPAPVTQRFGPTPLRDALNLTGAHNSLETLDTDDDRLQQVWLAKGHLYSALTTAVFNSSGPLDSRTGLAWFVVKPAVNSCTLNATVSAQGYVAATNASLMFPAIAVNQQGRGVLAFGVVGRANFPSVAYAPVDGSRVSRRIELVATGAGPEDGFTGYSGTDQTGETLNGNGIARWGDYSSATVSPEGDVWYAVEYIPRSPRTPLADWGSFVGKR